MNFIEKKKKKFCLVIMGQFEILYPQTSRGHCS